MALRFIDGFDHYAIPAQMPLKYTTVSNASISTMVGRRAGSVAVKLYNSGGDRFAISLDDQTTWIVGFAFCPEINSTNTAKTVQFVDATSSVQLTLCLTNGVIQLYRGDGSVLLTTAAQTLQAGVWNYIEVKAVIADTNGTFEVRVNEQVWATYTGDTKYSSSLATARTIRFGCASWVGTGFHDLYICDGTGNTNNDYLGDCRIDTLYPDGQGSNAAFTPVGSTANWENVDETPADADTSYNTSDVVGDVDTFSFDDLGTNGNVIHGAQINLMARKDDAGPRILRAIALNDGTIHEGSNISLSDSYLIYRHIWEQNPSAATSWTETDINAAEFGYKVQA
ncbi:MAG: hypothetical protein AB7S81_00515 [Bdellovibrionales bacterium]